MMRPERLTLRQGDHIYLIGIGGIGMSALAPELLRRGFRVSGSDPVPNELTRHLQSLGVTVHDQHRAENIQTADWIVFSSAIRESNPERKAAMERNLPCWPRAQMLGFLLDAWRSIVVTGAHGKTTITAMLTHVLTECGFDPTAFVGGYLDSLQGNTRLGQGEWAIAEGDESDGSFTYLHPHIAIINNIDADHLDFYSTVDEIIERFHRFLDGMKRPGLLFSSADCPYCSQLKINNDFTVIRYGFSEKADLRALHYQCEQQGSSCLVRLSNGQEWPMKLHLYGQANLHNALAVLGLTLQLGIAPATALQAIQSFQGVQRRLELKGESGGITLLDDYAHHPAEIRATIQALRDRFPQRRLLGVFQPHLYSRTIKLLDEFSDSFHGLDKVILTDIYPAREEPILGVDGSILLDQVKRKGLKAIYFPDKEEIPHFLLHEAKPGDVIVTLGAGDINKVGESFLQHLPRKEGET